MQTLYYSIHYNKFEFNLSDIFFSSAKFFDLRKNFQKMRYLTLFRLFKIFNFKFNLKLIFNLKLSFFKTNINNSIYFKKMFFFSM